MTTAGPNVLLVVLDSLRARNTSLSGYERETTPAIGAFAADATTYTEARAAAARSLPSHVSLFTGHPPQAHGVHALDRRVAPGKSIFAELQEAGYETALFTDNPYVADLDTGLNDGFDRVENDRDPFPGLSPAAFVEESGLDYGAFVRAALVSDSPLGSLGNALAWTAKWRSTGVLERAVFTRGEVYADRFSEWRTGRDGPWAACLNLMDTHVPFRPATAFDRWQTDESRAARKRADTDDIDKTETWKHQLELNAYDGTARQADAAVGRIVDDLRAADELDDTLVVVTSDHGEGFGERSLFDGRQVLGHGGSVDETVLHVPLVVRRPGQRESETVREPVTIAEFPAVVRRATGPGDGPVRFGSQEPVAQARIDGEAVSVYYESAERGVRKYVVAPSRAYVEAVPNARVSYRTDETVPDSVQDELTAFEDAGVTVEADVDVDERTERRLAALGYTE